jgi:hypothetical protein
VRALAAELSAGSDESRAEEAATAAIPATIQRAMLARRATLA